MSSRFSGSRSSGSVPSAWRARSQSSALAGARQRVGEVVRPRVIDRLLERHRKLSATLPDLADADSRQRCFSRPVRLGGQILRLADHRDQHAAFGEPLGGAAGVLDGHRVDHGVALVDVVDAEIVELDLQQSWPAILVEVSKLSA